MKRYIFTGLLLSVALVLFGASAELELYIQFYDMSATLVGKMGLLQEVVKAAPEGAEEFYAYALDDLVMKHPRIQGNQEMNAADSIARVTLARLGAAKGLSDLLGEERYRQMSLKIWRVVNSYSNPLVRSDAMIALGRLNATEYLPQIVKILSNLNGSPTTDWQTGELLAYGAISALDAYGDISGYIPVFLAANGWYSDRIRRQAASTLANISDDPTEPLISLIRSPGYTCDLKLLALQTASAADSLSTDKKAEVAIAAYTEALRLRTTDAQLRMTLLAIRKLSIAMVREYGTEDAAVYPLLERSYNEGLDEEEKIGALGALSALASDDSVRLLSAFLIALNVRLQDDTLTRVDERMVRTIIPFLGATRKPGATTALRSVESTVKWTYAVRRLATEALRNVSNQQLSMI